jgi:hypothetical protein
MRSTRKRIACSSSAVAAEGSAASHGLSSEAQNIATAQHSSAPSRGISRKLSGIAISVARWKYSAIGRAMQSSAHSPKSRALSAHRHARSSHTGRAPQALAEQVRAELLRHADAHAELRQAGMQVRVQAQEIELVERAAVRRHPALAERERRARRWRG